MKFYFIFILWVTSSNADVTPDSTTQEVTPGSAQETVCNAEGRTWANCRQGKHNYSLSYLSSPSLLRITLLELAKATFCEMLSFLVLSYKGLSLSFAHFF